MREFKDLASFAGFLTGTLVAADHIEHELLDLGAKVIEKEAKRVLGTYDYGWPQLAPSTQAQRVRLGFPANEPLLRTGDLRDSIEHTVVRSAGHNEAHIGSNNDKAVWHELGTSRAPPRPFLSGAAAAKGKEVAGVLGKGYVAKLFGP